MPDQTPLEKEIEEFERLLKLNKKIKLNLNKAVKQACLTERKKVIEEVARELHGDGSCTCVSCTTIRDIFDIINDMKELNQ